MPVSAAVLSYTSGPVTGNDGLSMTASVADNQSDNKHWPVFNCNFPVTQSTVIESIVAALQLKTTGRGQHGRQM